jgi:Dual specificity phosphatase, catalytic domain
MTCDGTMDKFCLSDIHRARLVTHTISFRFYSYTLLSKGIEHAYVPTLDILGYPLLPKHWEECGAFLQTVYDDYKCFEDGQREVESKTTETSLSVGYNQQQNSVARAAGGTHSKVFVHCEAGINRSGTIVAAAMMYFAKVPMLQAIRQLKRQRGTIMTNATFQEQLVDFATELFGDGVKIE